MNQRPVKLINKKGVVELKMDFVFFKHAYESACNEWKSKLEEHFPEMFKENIMHAIGNIYFDDQFKDEWLLSLVDYNKELDIHNQPCYAVVLINPKTGNRYSNLCYVVDPNNITKSEFYKITNNNSSYFKYKKLSHEL